ncbi:MAG: hypothetical protein LBC35_01285 [Coriobacteriales bacterium]|nr:hypothetical protein [Coriobacteriales bacterium]
MPKTPALSLLERRRLRVVKATVCAVMALLILLSVWQCFSSPVGSLTLGSFLTEPLANGPDEIDKDDGVGEAGEAAANGDPLGIAGEEIVYIRSSDDGSILWYQSSASPHYATMLLDQALVAVGWHPLSGEQSGLLSYRFAPTAHQAGAGMVISIAEQADGCSVIIRII